MSVLVLLEMKMKPENVDDLTDCLKSELHATRGCDGCNGLAFHRNQDDPNTMIAVEDSDSRQQYKKYLAWRTDRGDFEKLTGWMEGDPSIRFFDKRGRIAPSDC